MIQESGLPGSATMAAPSEYLASEDEEEWVGEDNTDLDVAGGMIEEEPADVTG